MSAKPHIFLFTGKDSFTIARKVQRWKEEFIKKHGAHGLSVLDICGKQLIGADIWRALKSRSLFQVMQFTILKNISEFPKDENLVGMLSDLLEALPQKHFVVLQGSELDKRTILYKKICALEKKGVLAVERYDIPRGETLLRWIREESTRHGIGALSEKLASMIAERFDLSLHDFNFAKECSYDLWGISHELEKLAAYANGAPITAEMIDLLVPLNSDAHIFSFSDSLLAGKKRAAFQQAELLLSQERDPKAGLIKTLAFLKQQFKSFFMVRSMLDARRSPQHIADALSWDSKRVWVVSKKVQAVSAAHLSTALKHLLSIEQQAKRTRVNAGALLCQFIARVTQPQRS